MKLRAITFCLVLGCLAALSPAPIYDRHAPSKISPEASQQELANEQKLEITKGVVGSVPLNTRVYSNTGMKSDDKASTTLQSAQARMQDNASATRTIEALRTAQRNVESSKPAPLRTFLWLIFAGCFGYGAFFALRRWADKVVPESAELRKESW